MIMYNKTNKPLFLLNFNESVGLCETKVKLPFLIDKRDNVLLGNSMRGFYEVVDEVECIVVDYDPYIMQPLAEIEIALIEENDKHRIKQIEKELKKYFQTFNQIEAIRLFDLPPDDSLVTVENFKQPPAYNFEKGKRKDEEGDEHAGLFGGARDG